MIIKKEFERTVVAFGGNGFCLGERSEEDLVDLAIIGYDNKTLHRFFDTVPTLEELKYRKMVLVEERIKNIYGVKTGEITKGHGEDSRRGED